MAEYEIIVRFSGERRWEIEARTPEEAESIAEGLFADEVEFSHIEDIEVLPIE